MRWWPVEQLGQLGCRHQHTWQKTIKKNKHAHLVWKLTGSWRKCSSEWSPASYRQQVAPSVFIELQNWTYDLFIAVVLMCIVTLSSLHFIWRAQTFFLREDETRKLEELLSGCDIAMWRSIPTAAGSLQQVPSIAVRSVSMISTACCLLFESFGF